MVALCQLGSSGACRQPFNSQIYILEHPPLPFIPLNDLAADFLEPLFDFEQRFISNNFSHVLTRPFSTSATSQVKNSTKIHRINATDD
jgi:hypothetical protein